MLLAALPPSIVGFLLVPNKDVPNPSLSRITAKWTAASQVQHAKWVFSALRFGAALLCLSHFIPTLFSVTFDYNTEVFWFILAASFLLPRPAFPGEDETSPTQG